MSIPVTYTEDQLKAYLVLMLGEVAGVLGWDTTTPQLNEVLTETLIAYDVAGLADATDIPKLRRIARYEVWKAAVDALAGIYDATGDAGMLIRSQVYTHAVDRLSVAQADAAADLKRSPYRVQIIPIVRRRRPFSVPITERPEA